MLKTNMNLNLTKLKYSFKKKPLLIGGKAMEYYGLRKAGNDIDLIVDVEDIAELIKLFPNRIKDLWGDLGVCPFEFEIWKTICLFDYSYYKKGAIEKDDYLIISLENLLFMKALALKKEKYLNDLKLIVNHILVNQGDAFKIQDIFNKKLMKGIKNISYIEKTGPEV
jgi:hypothetical protein